MTASYTTAQVNAWYQSVQFRDGPTATVSQFVTQLNAGVTSPGLVQSSIIQDVFTAAYVNPVVRLYQAAFNRVPDQTGQEYWVDSIAAGTETTQSLANAFANSTEFQNTYGASASTPASQAVVTVLYYQVLNRAPDTAGLTYWTSNGFTTGFVLNQFAQSPEFVVATQAAIPLFQQAEIAGTEATSGALWQYGGFPGNDYTLTTGVDTVDIQGSWGIVSGTGTTFTAGDTITAASSSQGNQLVINDTTGASASGVPTGVTVNNVQTAGVTSNGTVGRAASAGTAQVDTIALGSAASTAPVQQSNTYVFSTAAAVASQAFTYGSSNGSYLSDTTAATQALNFIAAVNSVAGQTIAYQGGSSVANSATAQAGTTITVDGALAGAARVGQSIAVASGVGAFAAGTTITAVTSTTITVSVAPTTGIANDAVLTTGGGATATTVYAPAAGTASPAIAFGAVASVGSVPSASLTIANGASQVVNVNYGSATGTYVESGNTTTDATAMRAVLASLAGPSAVIGGTGTNVTITSATAGTALPTVTVTAGAGNTGTLPTVSITTPNGSAAVSAVVYNVSGFTGLTQFNGSSNGGANINAASTTSVTETDAALGTGSIAINGGNNVTVNATGGTTGTITLGATTGVAGNATVTNTQSIVTGTGGAITVNGGTVVTVNSTTSGNADNTTATLGAVTVNGGASTTSVTVNQTAAVVASSTVAGVANGAVTILDANRATSVADTIAAVTLNNYGNSTIESGALATLSLSGTAGTLGVNANVAGANQTATTLGLTVNGLKGTNSITLGASTGTSSISTLNITGTGASSTIANVTAAGVTALNFSGDKAVILTNNTFSALSTVVSTNTAGVTLGTTALGTGVSFTGGDGADSIILSNSFTKAISMGAGDDTVTYGGAAATGGSVNAGTGINTIKMTSAQADAADANATFNSTFSNFNILDVTATNASVTVNLAGINAVNEVVARTNSTALAQTLTLNGFTTGGKLTLDSSGDGVARYGFTVGVTNSGLSSTDVFNVDLKNTTSAALNFGTVTAANVETINLTTIDDGTGDNVAATIDALTLVATSATSVTVKGDNGLLLTNTGNVAITSFDASGVKASASEDTSANLAVTFASANTTSGATVSIIGGDGNDELTGNAGIDTITGNAGADSVAGGLNQDVINTGVGRDYIATTSDNDDGTTPFSDSTTAAPDTINGFVLSSAITSSTDLSTVALFQEATAGGANTSLVGLELLDTGGTAPTLAVEADGTGAGQAAGTTYTVASGIMTIGGAGASSVTTLGQWLTQAAAVAATDGDTLAFQFGGNTYIFAQNDAVDVLLNLSGVTGAAALTLVGVTTTTAANSILLFDAA